MKVKSELTASLGNYLTTIYEIVKTQKAARAKDISTALGIGASSVSEALRNLADKKYINYEPYGIVTLSAKGKKIAVELIKRHEIICGFLRDVLLIDEEIVDANASKIEYGVSGEVLEKFVRFLTFMQSCSCKEPKWIKSFKFYAKNGEFQDKCISCIQESNAKACNSSTECTCQGCK